MQIMGKLLQCSQLRHQGVNTWQQSQRSGWNLMHFPKSCTADDSQSKCSRSGGL